MRAISIATLRRKRSACTKSTAERKRDWRKMLGHASGTCILSWLSPPRERQLLERRGRFGEQNQCPANRRANPAASPRPEPCRPSSPFRVRRDRPRSPADLSSTPGSSPRAALSRWRVASKSSLLGTLDRSPASGAADRVQHQHGVFDAARHRAEFVERPAQRHRAGTRHAAEGGTQAGDAAAHRRADDAAAGLAADGEGAPVPQKLTRPARRSIPTSLPPAARDSSSGRRTRCR